MSRAVGRRPLELAQSYLRLAFGQGRISFRDFDRLRLFDPPFHADAQLCAYVGQRENRDICVTANYRHDFLGLVANKVAATSYLAAYRLPVIPIKALYTADLTHSQFPVICDRAALESFLLNPEVYPLFGKPADGFQSLGSIAVTGVSTSRREVQTAAGATIGLDAFVSDVLTHFAGGYLFQDLARPHPDIAALCGNRLACARIVTTLCEDGPRVMRAALKIPAAKNNADNYWRPGNLLAQIDIASGRILRAVSGTGLATREHTHHPDTGAALSGFVYPDWPALKALALEGARLMRQVPLIGWDLATTVEGPQIVEMNATPDFFLVQFADRRGILDQDFRSFLSYQKQQAKAHLQRMKRQLRKL